VRTSFPSYRRKGLRTRKKNEQSVLIEEKKKTRQDKRRPEKFRKKGRSEGMGSEVERRVLTRLFRDGAHDIKETLLLWNMKRTKPVRAWKKENPKEKEGIIAGEMKRAVISDSRKLH